MGLKALHFSAFFTVIHCVIDFSVVPPLTAASQMREKEAGNINNSLHILGKCIEAMRHNQNKRYMCWYKPDSGRCGCIGWM